MSSETLLLQEASLESHEAHSTCKNTSSLLLITQLFQIIHSCSRNAIKCSGVNWKLQPVLNSPDLSYVIIHTLCAWLCDVWLLALWALFLLPLMCQQPDGVLVWLSVLGCVSHHALNDLFIAVEYSRMLSARMNTGKATINLQVTAFRLNLEELHSQQWARDKVCCCRLVLLVVSFVCVWQSRYMSSMYVGQVKPIR